MWINKLKKFFLNLFFPINCFGCGKEGFFLCLECREKIPLFNKLICPACGKPSLYGKTCPDCRSSLAGIIIAVDYNQSLLRKSIRSLKYPPFIFTLAKDLAGLLAEFVGGLSWHLAYFKRNNFILTPIPLSRQKLARRGFNQAELMAKEMSSEFGWPLEEKILRKIKETKSQTELGKKERSANVKDAFRVKNEESVRNKNIILLDDIFTTGATLEEAAGTLRRAGANEVWAMVLAKG